MRTIIIALLALILLGSMVFRLASNKSKINIETSYHDSIANVAVNIRTAQRIVRNNEIDLIGIFRPSREAVVSAEIPGKITNVFVKEGDYVSQGQVIVELDRSQLDLKLEADKAQFQHSSEELARYENLSKKDATTDATLKQMRLTNTLNGIAVKNDEDQIGKSSIRAAISGFLTSKNFEVGMNLTPAAPLGLIVNTQVLKFTAMVPEYQVVKLGLSQKVTVRADVFPGIPFSGTISQIAAKGDDNHQYKVEVAIQNTNRRYPLKAEMNGSMVLLAKEPVIGFFMPSGALVGTAENPELYVVSGNRALLRKVSAGPTFGDEIQILDGLRDGDNVITTGMNSLRDSATVNIFNGR